MGGLPPHEGDGDVVVAVEPGYLLGQVGDALHISPPRGDDHIGGAVGAVLVFGADAHTGQVLVLLHSGDIGTQEGVHPVRVHGDGAGLGYIVEDVNDSVQHLAGPQQLYQLTGPVDGGKGVQGVQALFVLCAGLGPHP